MRKWCCMGLVANRPGVLSKDVNKTGYFHSKVANVGVGALYMRENSETPKRQY